MAGLVALLTGWRVREDGPGKAQRGPREAHKKRRRDAEEAQKASGVVQPWAAMAGRGQP